jgi:ATP-dependent DNA helicase RecG
MTVPRSERHMQDRVIARFAHKTRPDHLGACREAGTPAPQLEWSGHELRLQFAFAGEYITEAGETPVKTPDAILAILREQPGLRLTDVAEALGKSSSAVERAARKLREEGRLRYVGPQKGGRWEVLR